MEKARKEALNTFCKKVKIRFKNLELLDLAFHHRSITNEMKHIQNNERLEFLGDSVLGIVTAAYLYNTFPNPEGDLAKIKSAVVSEKALAPIALSFGIDKLLVLGKGEESTGGRHRDSIISDVMEAVIGAIYIDGGIEAAKKHIDKFILNDLENKQIFIDAKSVLQELVQKDSSKTLSYEIYGESGPEHDKIFKSRVLVNGEILGEGEGHTKKAAEQQAAYQAVLKLRDKA